ncbi:tRNA lysidine(34) synthetase TilS [Rhodobacter sp. Har01]|uniref:tRNA lysidine(34) synthetase TilS n=1 Tax=Rhodobacter sp. Har01 TaxID=2883999 RepID=UPI001D08FABD|nr:tRNA lysidine(34) synthetase TilS [Rhodobacter sp. Har01]MCB6178408.1 tRNA lysidine(34) synthetase TilS [Rhodobacter sp. Har01]
MAWPLDQGEDAELLLAVAYAFPPHPARKLGVAVSGGGDSVALLHLTVRACRHQGVPVQAVTVDHRLRPGSADEARMVAALCATLDIPHHTLTWDHGPVAGNLMDAARQARSALIAGWAIKQGVTHVALGHTADDQAESFLMALSRASGLDGLVGLRRNWKGEGIDWGRPLLDATRAGLRAYLRRHGIAWVDDPTNEDPRFERVRARKAMAALAPLGIDATRIGQTLSHLQFAKWALDDMLRKAIRDHVREVAGALRVDYAGFEGLPAEVQRQVLMAGLAWLSGKAPPPRTDKQFNLLNSAREGRDVTLHGCRLRVRPDHLLLTREPRALSGLVATPGGLWDRRWRVDGPTGGDMEIRALGSAGLQACPDWRATGLSRQVLEVTPGVWRGEALVAAPCAGFGTGWTAKTDPSFATFLLSH